MRKIWLVKATKNYQLLFDAECPMCKAYTRAITRSGLLTEKGRVAYQDLDPAACPMVDRQRAVDEIALINLETGEVSYGIISLFSLFATVVPFLKPLFFFGPFVWVMSKVYTFIASNRRVIVPPAKNTASFGLQPTFRLGYRIAYLLFTMVITGFLINKYVLLLNDPLPVGDLFMVIMLLAGQLIVQSAVLLLVAKNKTIDYLGNLMTINAAGALLLIPLLVARSFIYLPPMVSAIYLGLIIILVFVEHFRRTAILGIGLIPVVTWAAYTFFVLK